MDMSLFFFFNRGLNNTFAMKLKFVWTQTN